MPLLASDGLLIIFGIPQLIEASSPSLHLMSHGVVPVCMSVSKFPLFRKTSVLMDYRPPYLV